MFEWKFWSLGYFKELIYCLCRVDNGEIFGVGGFFFRELKIKEFLNCYGIESDLCGIFNEFIIIIIKNNNNNEKIYCCKLVNLGYYFV